jgi:hypothetical protein
LFRRIGRNLVNFPKAVFERIFGAPPSPSVSSRLRCFHGEPCLIQ